MAQIRIPTPLRPYAANQDMVMVRGSTVEEALRDLTAQYPDLEPHLFNNGSLRSFVNVFLGEEDVRYLEGVNTPVKDDDQLRIIPSIAGG